MSANWQPIETAPKGETVIAYSAGCRFMRQDAGGQWRNMMGAPKGNPTHWMPLPEPPQEST